MDDPSRVFARDYIICYNFCVGLLDIIFPKRCIGCKKFGDYLCSNCFPKLSYAEYSLCFICQRGTLDGRTHPRCRSATTIDGVFVGLVYNNISRRLITALKYRPYLADLAPYLTDILAEQLIQNELFVTSLSPDSIFVPVPLHASRLRQRGYNQSELLGKALAKKFSLKCLPLLERTRKTKSQVGLNKEERRKNMHDAFSIKKGATLPKVVFLVDDVVTSGATLLEAARVLKKAGVKEVYGIALAHGN